MARQVSKVQTNTSVLTKKKKKNDRRVGLTRKTKTIGANVNKCGSHLRASEVKLSRAAPRLQLFLPKQKVAGLSNSTSAVRVPEHQDLWPSGWTKAPFLPTAANLDPPRPHKPISKRSPDGTRGGRGKEVGEPENPLLPSRCGNTEAPRHGQKRRGDSGRAKPTRGVPSLPAHELGPTPSEF